MDEKGAIASAIGRKPFPRGELGHRKSGARRLSTPISPPTSLHTLERIYIGFPVKEAVLSFFW